MLSRENASEHEDYHVTYCMFKYHTHLFWYVCQRGGWCAVLACLCEYVHTHM